MALVLTLSAAQGSALSAQRPGEEPPVDSARVIPLDPVVVTVTHLEVLRSRVPNAVSVVTREQIRESGAPSVLAVVNERVPGLFVTQRGVLGYGVAGGAAGRISIRGAGASPNTQVLVMTDGRPQMMGLMGHPLADTHVSSGVERVEVIRGPASVLYGTAALGGVVNVITRRGWAPGVRTEAGASYGSFGTQRLEGTVEYGFGAHSGVSVAGNRYATDGHRPESSFAIDNLSLRGSTRLGAGLTLMVDGAASDLRSYDPGPAVAPRVDNWADILRTTSGVTLENRSGVLSGATKLFFNTGRHEIHDGFHSRDHTFGMQLHQGIALPTPGATLTLGGDAKRFGGRAENTARGIDWGGHSVEELGVFGMIHHPLAARVVATTGLRLNHHSVYGSELAPQAGVAVGVGAGTTLKASSARGFRSPTIRELYLFPAPNPELEPERAWSHEVSLLRNFGQRASLELVAYRMTGSNLIRTSGAPPNLVLGNTGRFVHRGGELSLTALVSTGVEVDLSYGFLDVGELTQSHPKHQASAAVRWALPGAITTLSLQHVAGLYGLDGGQGRLPDYTVASARVAFWLPGRVMLHVAGENLLGEDYMVMPGYPMPGRVFSVGVQARARQ